MNDVEYSALIVDHYARRGYGKMRIRDELYRRGIPRELWEDAMARLPDMEDTVYRTLTAKLSGRKIDSAELKKAADALYRRGFTWDDIKPAVERFKVELNPGQLYYEGDGSNDD